MKKKNHPDRAPTIILGLLIAALAVAGSTHDWNGTARHEKQAEKAEAAKRDAKEEQLQEHKDSGNTDTAEAGEPATGRQEPEHTYRYIQGCPLPQKTQQKIFDICAGANLSYELVMALAKEESGWDPSCISDGGESVGLMQVQKRWHRELMDKLGCNDLKDPVQNVRVGTEILKRHFETYQDAAAALMAYNGGQAYARRMMEQGIISRYASDILKQAAEYEEENGI